MLKKVFSSLAMALIFMASAANAMQLNLNLDPNMQKDKDLINVAVHLQLADGNQPTFDFSSKGIPYQSMDRWLIIFNKMVAQYHPIGNSEISLGYTKNGTAIYPVSCQNLHATEVTTVTLTEAGCN
jgi:hypothetical protein